MSVWLNYYAERMRLMRELGVMQLDEHGSWLDLPLADVLGAPVDDLFPLPLACRMRGCASSMSTRKRCRRGASWCRLRRRMGLCRRRNSTDPLRYGRCTAHAIRATLEAAGCVATGTTQAAPNAAPGPELTPPVVECYRVVDCAGTPSAGSTWSVAKDSPRISKAACIDDRFGSCRRVVTPRGSGSNARGATDVAAPFEPRFGRSSKSATGQRCGRSEA